MTDDTTITHQDGPPWKTVGRHPTFGAADTQRVELLEDSSVEVKIHYQGPRTQRHYAVKTRVNPDIAEAQQKKEEKARRKKKLSKKRRKK